MTKTLLLLVALGGLLLGQMPRQGGLSAPAWKRGTTAPASCTIGEIFFDTDAGAGQNLYLCTLADTWAQVAGAAGAHALLGATHSDTTGAAVSRGDVITGQGASPAWARLAKGAPNQFLRMDGTATDVGWGTVNASDIGTMQYVAGGGTAQAQTVTLAPAATLTAGLVVRWLPVAANTATAPTLAVNGLAAKAITKCGTAALVADDLTLTAIAIAVYDGTQFQLSNPQAVDCVPVYTAGSGGGVTVTGYEIEADSAVVPFYSTGAGAPSANCTAGQETYLNTTSHGYYYCSATNTWTLFVTGTVSASATADAIALRNGSGEVIAANTVATGKTPMATDTVVAASQLTSASVGGQVPVWKKYTIAYTNELFKVASTETTITLFTLPAKARILHVIAKHSVVFGDGAGAMTNVGGYVGDADQSDLYLSTLPIGEVTPVTDIAFVEATVPDFYQKASFAQRDILVYFASVARDFGSGTATYLTGGSLDIWVCWVQLS